MATEFKPEGEITNPPDHWTPGIMSKESIEAHMTDNPDAKVRQCPECGHAIYPPDKRNPIQKCLDMLADYMRMPSDYPPIVEARNLHDELVAENERLKGLLYLAPTHVDDLEPSMTAELITITKTQWGNLFGLALRWERMKDELVTALEEAVGYIGSLTLMADKAKLLNSSRRDQTLNFIQDITKLLVRAKGKLDDQ